jgi:hypothetical protein
MDAWIVAAVAVLPSFGLACWIFWATARTEEEMRTFAGFEGLHLEP